MNIAFITPHFLPIPAYQGGAVESLIETLVDENEKNNKINFTIFTVCPKAKNEKKEYTNTKLVYKSKPKIISLADKLTSNLIRKIRKDGNKVELNYVWKVYVIKYMRRMLLNNNFDFVVIENSMYLFKIFENKQLYSKYINKVIYHAHNKVLSKTKFDVSKLCKCVISISDYLHNNLQEMFGDVNIITVHNGIDTNLFSNNISLEDRNVISNMLELKNDVVKILFAGRIAPEKGVSELIDGFELAHIRNSVLIIVGSSYFGSGESTEYEKKIIAKVINNPNIITLGFQNKEKLSKLYSYADLIVLPSTWDEPLGLTMIEAQASGTPLITTIAGGIAETVDSKNSVLLTPNYDLSDQICNAIKHVINNYNDYAEKSKLNVLRIKKEFSKESFYKKFIDVIIGG